MKASDRGGNVKSKEFFGCFDELLLVGISIFRLTIAVKAFDDRAPLDDLAPLRPCTVASEGLRFSNKVQWVTLLFR